MRLIVLMVGVAAAIAFMTAATAPKQHPSPVREANKKEVARPSVQKCRSSREAVVWYRNATHMWQQKRQAERLAGPGPRVRGHSCGFARYAALEWRARAIAAHKTYDRWSRQWAEHVRRLNRGLQGTRWAGLGAFLVQVGRQTGISPYFAAAAAETESSIGAAACGYGGYNAWGLGNCSGVWSVPTFHSWYEAIPWWMRYVRGHWPNARTPWDFGGYAACSQCWGNSTAGHMESRFGVAPNVRFP